MIEARKYQGRGFKLVEGQAVRRMTSRRPRSDPPLEFPDNNVEEKFEWVKKRQLDQERGLSSKQLARYEDERREQNRQEIEKLKRQRLEREAERQRRDDERFKVQQTKEETMLGDWQEKERLFHLQQVRAKAALRISEKRPHPADLLVLNTDPSPSAAFLDSPLDLIRILAPTELESFRDEVTSVADLERDERLVEFWEAVVSVCDQERVSLEKGRDYGAEGHAFVRDDITQLLEGKGLQQLVQLESSVRSKLESDQAIDVDYWEGLLRELRKHKSQAAVMEIHEALLKHKKDGKGVTLAEFVAWKSTKPSLALSTPSASHSGSSSSLPNSPSPIATGPIDDTVNWDGCPAALALYENEATRPAYKDEVPFNDEADDIPKKSYPWAATCPSRKPRYFNRVRMNYDWNKYNQTHYDLDNPPPKVVQGYRFNVFYPELGDRSKSPTYQLERDRSNPDMCILRFVAGPPYEDLVFRILNLEWEMSNRAGFRCVFERGVLRLHFWYRRHKYRR